MLKAFTDHPETVGESYGEHLLQAWGFAATLATAALACLLHGLFPFAFQSAGSRRVRALHDRMVTHRARAACAIPPTALEPPAGADHQMSTRSAGAT
ncbi:MAG: DUF6356 family protein [Phenylobacterium sp.]|nr:DUF6356 family protein [Phenylobacterium sp.]